MIVQIVEPLFGPSSTDMVDRAIKLRQLREERLARRPLGAYQKRLLARLRRAGRPVTLTGRDMRVAKSLAARGLLMERVCEAKTFEAVR